MQLRLHRKPFASLRDTNKWLKPGSSAVVQAAGHFELRPSLTDNQYTRLFRDRKVGKCQSRNILHAVTDYPNYNFSHPLPSSSDCPLIKSWREVHLSACSFHKKLFICIQLNSSFIMSYISDIHARQILDSRGNPTVEVDVITDNGVLGSAAVPLAHLLASTKP